MYLETVAFSEQGVERGVNHPKGFNQSKNLANLVEKLIRSIKYHSFFIYKIFVAGWGLFFCLFTKFWGVFRISRQIIKIPPPHPTTTTPRKYVFGWSPPAVCSIIIIYYLCDVRVQFVYIKTVRYVKENQ